MNVVIRKATESDLEAILKLVNYQIELTTALYDVEPRTLEQQTEIFHHKQKMNFPILIAENEGVFLGFATYDTFRNKAAFTKTVEHSVYLTSEAQGKGIGSLLLKSLFEVAKNQKIHVMIGVIDAENKSSVDFHLKNGFEIQGHLKQVGFKFGKWLDCIMVHKIIQ